MSPAIPSAVVVMGVSGCGKTTVAERLAARLGWEFVEADTLHSEANVAKMRAGTPLTDEDRRPWLDALAARIDRARMGGRPCVVACSALKRAYRERLAGGHDDVLFVHLAGTREAIAARLAERRHAYMPPTLLASQFATLEPPAADERALTVSIDRTPDAQVEEIICSLSLGRGPGRGSG